MSFIPVAEPFSNYEIDPEARAIRGIKRHHSFGKQRSAKPAPRTNLIPSASEHYTFRHPVNARQRRFHYTTIYDATLKGKPWPEHRDGGV